MIRCQSTQTTVGKQGAVCYDLGISKKGPMIDPDANACPSSPSQRRWQPLGAVDRRVVGALAEKAKTTADNYPMSLNAICTGCNQKSNRSPLVQFEPSDVEESLDRLRELGVVGLVEGYGRVTKYRHYLYEWLAVDKVELAVMAELLLRGDQTVGELRARAARMEPIPDLAALRPVLDALKAKGLVVALTPEGRGHVVTHALYKPRELETLRLKYQGHGGAAGMVRNEEPDAEASAGAAAPSPAGASAPAAPPISQYDNGQNAAVRRELADVRDQVAQLRSDLEELRNEHQRVASELQTLKTALGG